MDGLKNEEVNQMVKLTGHSQLDANAMATSILSGG
jgi:hypothetical protein